MRTLVGSTSELSVSYVVSERIDSQGFPQRSSVGFVAVRVVCLSVATTTCVAAVASLPRKRRSDNVKKGSESCYGCRHADITNRKDSKM